MWVFVGALMGESLDMFRGFGSNARLHRSRAPLRTCRGPSDPGAAPGQVDSG